MAGGWGDDSFAGTKGLTFCSVTAARYRMGGGLGRDTLYGGPGDDILHARADDGTSDYLNCGPGNDTAYVAGE